MSITIVKQGLADSLQDIGRFGFQHLGINPNGVMDAVAAQTANALVGNEMNETVIECHFPASAFLFHHTTLVALSGADFKAMVNDIEVAINTPFIIHANNILHFKKRKNKARVYIAVQGGFKIEKWLNSCSTNAKANAGGLFGRFLKKDDVLDLNDQKEYKKLLNDKDVLMMPWKVSVEKLYSTTIEVIKGNEFELLQPSSQQKLIKQKFQISSQSDRMGYRLKAEELFLQKPLEMLSSAVTKGTVQLLPNGQLIVLMADHQTTGGYPRVVHVSNDSFPSLAQMNANDFVQFATISQQEAEDYFIKQQQYLHQLQIACNFRLTEFLQQHVY
ncbi:MAG: biotin-dependent carboxyltransferase family protein [Sphingobacteriia bacterium]|nr:biotin-dependent carboxyltransferase family protein [Sphingobacteriia bacterium]